MPEENETLPLFQRRRSPASRLLRRALRTVRRLYWSTRLAELGKRSDLAYPAHVHGGEHISIGKDVHIWREARLEVRAPEGVILTIGDGTKIQPHVHIGAIKKIQIGKGVLMASYVYITDHDHDISRLEDPPVSNRRVIASPVVIEDYVWLGERVMVLKGVSIGEHSVIGAGSIVTSDIPPWSLAVGTPARVVKRYNRDHASWEKVR